MLDIYNRCVSVPFIYTYITLYVYLYYMFIYVFMCIYKYMYILYLHVLKKQNKTYVIPPVHQ